MRKLLTLLLTVIVLSSQAQKTSDAQLKARLQEYLELTRQLEFDKLMDYIHPRLFAIVPRETMTQVMKQTFESKEMTFSFDTMSVVSIGPVFSFSNAAYRKVTYYLAMRVTAGDSTDLSDTEITDVMLSSFKTAFPHKDISIDVPNNAVKVVSTEVMFAIKDKEATNWKFLSFDKSDTELNRKLYPKQVRNHFKLW